MESTRGQVKAKAAIEKITEPTKKFAFLDVRSGDEFANEAIPGFSNAPVLNNEHRHRVGLCYKEEGQESAVQLGYQLTQPIRSEIISSWKKLSDSQPMIVACWRGGLRSKIACEWLNEAGVQTLQVEGGYKAMRSELLHVLESPPELFVLTGYTGSGKTSLLNALSRKTIDLEGLANHPGSSFGYCFSQTQPSQATFENALALEYFNDPRSAVVEDESRLIGKRSLPNAFVQKMQNAPRVLLLATLEERIRNVFNDYVLSPIRGGMNPDVLSSNLARATERIKERLGSSICETVTKEIKRSFGSDLKNWEIHSGWIEPLLTKYYDPLYLKARGKREGQIVFEGDRQACIDFLESQE